MKIGDLVTNTKKYNKEKSKIGIIISETDEGYSVKWLVVPVYDEFSEIEEKMRLTCTQTYFKNAKKMFFLYKLDVVNGKIRVVKDN